MRSRRASTTARFNKFCCAGAPIPPVLIERAQKVLGMRLCSAWGMTENGASPSPSRRARWRSPVFPMAVRCRAWKVVDANGIGLPPGESGSLLVRGASCSRRLPQAPAAQRYLGRRLVRHRRRGDHRRRRLHPHHRAPKDVVIRGGENIPVVEIENLLYQHPAIAVVAVVGYPDKRLGERVCAFVSLKPGASGEPTAYRAPQLTKQYFPERLEIVDDLPRTPSGKLQKFKLAASPGLSGTWTERAGRAALRPGLRCRAVSPCLFAVRNSHSKAKHERTRCRRNHRPGWPCPHQPPGSVQRAQRRRDERPRRGARPFRGRPSDPLRGPHRIGQGLRGRRRHHGHPPLDYMDAYKGNLITRNWERLKSFRKPVIAAVSGWRWAAAASWR
jgi:hypothetical protein